MKVVMIHGQNHKGSTWNTANILLSMIPGEKKIKEFFLPRDLNHFCMGCYACIEDKTKCPFREDKERIDNAIKAADLLIFTTPNYCMMPSAPMKAFLDLFFTNWLVHQPQEEMFGKQAIVISTASGAGAGKAAGLLAKNLLYWGIPSVKTYGISVQALNWGMVPEKKKKKIEKDMRKIASKIKSNVHVGIRTKLLFWIFKGLQNANLGASKHEKEYWKSKGWLDGKTPWKDL